VTQHLATFNKIVFTEGCFRLKSVQHKFVFGRNCALDPDGSATRLPQTSEYAAVCSAHTRATYGDRSFAVSGTVYLWQCDQVTSRRTLSEDS